MIDGVAHDISEEIRLDIVEFHRDQLVEVFGASNGENDTGTEESTAADTGDESSPEPEGSSNEDTPGFGIVQSIAAVGGISYLLSQKLFEKRS